MYGSGIQKEMTMREVAEALDIHESTVGRAIKNKYLQCPRGTFSFRSLFSKGNLSKKSTGTGVPQQKQENAGREAVKARIFQIVSQENKAKPYSDNQIAALLAQEKLAVARRTVAKYREELQIPGATVRKGMSICLVSDKDV